MREIAYTVQCSSSIGRIIRHLPSTTLCQKQSFPCTFSIATVAIGVYTLWFVKVRTETLELTAPAIKVLNRPGLSIDTRRIINTLFDNDVLDGIPVAPNSVNECGAETGKGEADS